MLTDSAQPSLLAIASEPNTEQNTAIQHQSRKNAVETILWLKDPDFYKQPRIQAFSEKKLLLSYADLVVNIPSSFCSGIFFLFASLFLRS